MNKILLFIITFMSINCFANLSFATGFYDDSAKRFKMTGQKRIALPAVAICSDGKYDLKSSPLHGIEMFESSSGKVPGSVECIYVTSEAAKSLQPVKIKFHNPAAVCSRTVESNLGKNLERKTESCWTLATVDGLKLYFSFFPKNKDFAICIEDKKGMACSTIPNDFDNPIEKEKMKAPFYYSSGILPGIPFGLKNVNQVGILVNYQSNDNRFYRFLRKGDGETLVLEGEDSQ